MAVRPGLKPFGFSAIELMVVVIIIGILATMALPNFSKAAERARIRSALAVLSAIHSAERVYYLDQGEYGTDTDLWVNNNYLANPNSDPDWSFRVGTGRAPFSAVAHRTSGSYKDNEIRFNGTDYECGSYPSSLCP